MTIEFKAGDRVKWVDRDNDSEILYGVVNTDWGALDRTCVQYDCDPSGNRWFKFIPTVNLRHAGDDLSYCTRYFSGDWDITPIAEKKGYEPDGFDREAFDDFMRNL